jgi:NADH:ubiquinone oxidoreductase subunit 5 (subunit L)/multisubunit Na+/H+ antiporter MnhA subunit
MIKLQFEIAIFLYLLISIFGFLTAWLIFLKIKIPKKTSEQFESICQCSICTYIYVDSKNKVLTVCPRCGSYNERGGGH